MFVRPDKIALGEGKYCSQQCHGQAKLGEANPMWRGVDAKYHAIHRWIEARLPKPDKCPRCGKKGWLDLHNLIPEYGRNIKNWIWLCRRCHMVVDGRASKMKWRIYEAKENITKEA